MNTKIKLYQPCSLEQAMKMSKDYLESGKIVTITPHNGLYTLEIVLS